MPFPMFLAAPILDVVAKVIDRVIPDKAAADKAKLDLMSTESRQEFELMLAQVKVNEEEAKSTNWFVAGWRPCVGWVCGLSLMYAALVEPLLRFTATVIFAYAGEYPVIDTALTLQILLGLLGLGAMRSTERIKGVERN